MSKKCPKRWLRLSVAYKVWPSLSWIGLPAKFLVIVALNGLLHNLNAQTSHDITLEVIYGYQKHDKRFFGNPLENRQGLWGTSYFGLRAAKKIFKRGAFAIKSGVGYAREINTYSNPYDLCFDRPGQPCPYVLARIKNYRIDMVQTPLIVEARLLSKLRLELAFVPHFDIYKKVTGHGETAGFTFDLYSLELIPALAYNIRRFSLGLGFRMHQWKVIDQVYSYGNNFLRSNPGYLNKTFDTHNPTKLVLSVGYQWH